MNTNPPRTDLASLILTHPFRSACIGSTLLVGYDLIASLVTQHALTLTPQSAIVSTLITLAVIGLIAITQLLLKPNTREIFRAIIITWILCGLLLPSVSFWWPVSRYQAELLTPRMIAELVLLAALLIAATYGWFRLIRNRITTGDFLSSTPITIIPASPQ